MKLKLIIVPLNSYLYILKLNTKKFRIFKIAKKLIIIFKKSYIKNLN